MTGIHYVCLAQQVHHSQVIPTQVPSVSDQIIAVRTRIDNTTVTEASVGHCIL